jgi:uncharacterized protein YkwD
MEGSKHRFLSAARTALAGAILTGVVALAGCGGGGSDKPAVPPTPAGGAGAGGVVSAEGTQGLVGPAARASEKGTSATDRTSKIPGNANRPVQVHKNGVAGEADCPGAGATPTAGNLADINNTILCLVNAERRENGNLPPLSNNPQLQQAAEGMAARMVKEQFFSHETPDGKNVVDRVEPTGYIPDSGDWVVGENLAWGSGALSTPQAIVNGWMNSPGHKANILATDYKDIGLAAAMGSPSPSQSGGTTYVNNFGAKSGADTSASLPPESGASGSDNSGGGGGDQASTSSASGSDQAVASTKKAKAKKKAKKKKRKKKKRKRRH